MREGELTREVEDQSTVSYEQEIEELVQEVENQSPVNVWDKKATRKYICWMCGNRPFNARHQFLDHVEGVGGGGKSHCKMRKRWIEAGQPMREVWLEMLEKEKMEAGNVPATDAASSSQKVTSTTPEGNQGRRTTEDETDSAGFAFSHNATWPQWPADCCENAIWSAWDWNIWSAWDWTPTGDAVQYQ